MMKTKVVLLVLCFLFANSKSEKTIMKRIRNCLTHEHTLTCLKEETVEVLNESINSTSTISVYNLFDIVKDPEYVPQVKEEVLPENVTLRDARLTDLLYERFDELINSRTVRLSSDSVVEGRKKGDGKGKTGMMMMAAGMAMAGMMGKMMMGKLAFISGAALITAKLALFLSAIMALKKLSSSGGGGGGETKHIVYTQAQPDYGHSHGDSGGGYGGGSWHRSLGTHEDPQAIIYKAHVPEDSSYM